MLVCLQTSFSGRIKAADVRQSSDGQERFPGENN